MPASRPVWKGQLRLSLVSINVEMFPAHKSGATSQPSTRSTTPSGKPIHYQKVVDGIGPVDSRRDQEGLSSTKRATMSCSTTTRSTPSSSRPARRSNWSSSSTRPRFRRSISTRPISWSPADDLAEDAFRVVRDALRKSKKIGLGQLALRGKEYLVAIKPFGKGILLETLHYEEEIKKSDPYFSEIPAKSADPDLLEVATALIDKKTAEVRPEDLQGSLPGRAARTDRPQAQVQGPPHRGRGRAARIASTPAM